MSGLPGAELVLGGLTLAAASGLPGLFLARSSPAGERIAALAMGLAALLGMTGSLLALLPGRAASALTAPWPVPGGELRIEVDALSALFLLPIFLVPALGSIYGLRYRSAAEHPEDGRKLRLFYGLLTAGMALLIVARNGLLFLAGWEVMAASAFLVLTTDDRDPEVRSAGFVYLVSTRLGTLALFALFALLHAATGSTSFGLPGQQVVGPLRPAVFCLALFAFGLKAGMVPLHVWLPGAHAAAPSHVSAVMSGVLLKTGIYGLVRVGSLLPQPPLLWAQVLLAFGVASAVAGVALALGQHDLKRLLAYHSVENIGIILIGLGVALTGRALGRHDLVVLGLSGALLHVWNHGLFKSLLFLAAGSVIHAARSRRIDELGGLARGMPRTAAAFLLGAVAICGLPPLNGFISEWLIYLGLLRSVAAPDGGEWLGAALALPALALVGSLALLCFVKVHGAVFLGQPRSPHAAQAHTAHDSSPAPSFAMAVLAALCLGIGLLPAALPGVLGHAVERWLPAADAGAAFLPRLAPFGRLNVLVLVLAALLATLGLLLRRRIAAAPRGAAPTWGCGYPSASPRMQYTSSSFARSIVRLLSWILLPRRATPRIEGCFPAPSSFASEVPDPALDRAILPGFGLAARLTGRLRWIQRGSVHAYLAYILLTLVLLHVVWR